MKKSTLQSILFGLSTLLISLSGNVAMGETMKPCVADNRIPYTLLYVDASTNQAVYSYPRNLTDKNGYTIIYVSQANGPAIYSYPHNTKDTVAEFNVCFFNNGLLNR